MSVYIRLGCDFASMERESISWDRLMKHVLTFGSYTLVGSTFCDGVSLDNFSHGTIF